MERGGPSGSSAIYSRERFHGEAGGSPADANPLGFSCDTRPPLSSLAAELGISSYSVSIPNRTHIGGELLTGKARIAVSLPAVSILIKRADEARAVYHAGEGN